MANVFLVIVSLALVFSSSYGRGVEECRVGDWGEWTECEANSVVPDGHAPTSFPLPVTQQLDRGRAMMSIGRQAKEALAQSKADCMAAGTCPENNKKPTEGKAECENGFASSYPCQNIDLLSHLDFEALGYVEKMEYDTWPAGNDIWGWTDPETGDEYAIIGLTGGTSFVRVTDPEKPEALAFLYSRTHPSTWRDIKVIYNTAYIVSEAYNHGLQVFDLLRLRNKHEMSIVTADAEYSLFGNAHNIVANEETGYLYVVGATQKAYSGSCEGGLHFIDVHDRLKPVYAGCYAEDGYTHDAQCVIYHGPDEKYKGREVCFAYNEDTLTLVDVTDKSNPTLISKRGYTLAMYTHQGWLTEDHTTVLLDDELDEYYMDNQYTKTYIWDVTKLSEPVLKNTYYHTDKSIDHNQYILGDLTFQSNYGAGLRILHIDQENYNLREVAYFDVLPTNTRAEFEGTWSNYPYFKSGNVIVSSIDYGLFVVRPKYDTIRDVINTHAPESAHQHRARDILFAKRGAVCPALEEKRACSLNG